MTRPKLRTNPNKDFTMKTLLLGAMLLALAPVAHAGAFTDTLSVCLVKKTTDADKQLLVKWIFVALAQHPAVQEYAKVPKDKADQLNLEVGALYQALLVDRCGAETRDAMKYEGASAIQSSFQVLGQVASQGLMTDAKVAAFIGEMSKHMDLSALDAPAADAKPAPVPAPAKQ
jgi:hypothetical protein